MMIAHADASLKESHIGLGVHLRQPVTSSPSDQPVSATWSIQVAPDEYDFEYTSVRAEYLAVIESVRKASEYDVDMLMIASDCTGVVGKIQRGETITPSGVLRRILTSLLDEFDDWRVKHVSRSRNTTPHHEARTAIKNATGEALADS